jgi:DNA-directed RNA polymerase specialized sigma24 family protein
MADQQLEQFVIALGRAVKFSLRSLSGLSTADRDDVTAAALLAAIEDQAAAPVVGLDDWFREKVRAARRDLQTSRNPLVRAKLSDMASAEDLERDAALTQLADRITAEVDIEDQPLLEMYAQGFTCAEIAARIQATPTYVRRRLRTVRGRLGPLRKWLPDLPRVTETPHLSDSADDAPPPIDHAIEKMLRRPKTPRSDCPVCWRCCWYDGLAPHKHLVLQSTVDKRKRQIALTGICNESGI